MLTRVSVMDRESTVSYLVSTIRSPRDYHFMLPTHSHPGACRCSHVGLVTCVLNPNAVTQPNVHTRRHNYWFQSRVSQSAGERIKKKKKIALSDYLLENVGVFYFSIEHFSTKKNIEYLTLVKSFN